MGRGAGRTWRITASPWRSRPAKPITLYDDGRLKRDFTYIDDIVAGVVGVLDQPPAGTFAGTFAGTSPGTSAGLPSRPPPARVLNIGNHRAEEVRALVALLEQGLGRPAVMRTAPRPAADVTATFASVEAIAALTGFAPRVSLAEGIGRFVAWFRGFHGV